MSGKIKKILPILEFLNSLNKTARVKFLKKSHINLFKSLIDLVYNINLGNIYMPKVEVERLRKYKTQIKNLCAKKKGITERKKIIMKKDLLGKLLPILIPVLLDRISKKPSLPSPPTTPVPEEPTSVNSAESS